MSLLFVEYPKCSTCQKAKKWLETNHIEFIDRHIKEANPTEEELKFWHETSAADIKKFFNTSGVVYKSLNLKDKLPEMSLEEKYQILSTDGMLVKRPLIVGDDFILFGFKENEWKETLLK